MGLEALHKKNDYIKLKFSDQAILTSAKTSLDREKRQGDVQVQVFENNYKLKYNTLVQGYESELNTLRAQLSSEPNQQIRENIQQQINQIQTEKALALAQLQDEKDATTEMITQAKNQKETYWTKVVAAKEGDIEYDKNMIKYFQDLWKDFCASITGGKGSSQSSS